MFATPELGVTSNVEPGPFPAPFDLLVVAAAHTLVLMIVISASRLQGWRLIALTIFSYYGCVTFMSQIETAKFLTQLTVNQQTLASLFIMGIPPAVLFIPLAVLILGKAKKTATELSVKLIPDMSWQQWAWKLTLSIFSYLLLYFAAGYFIAWQNPELVAFYGGRDTGNFSCRCRLSSARIRPFSLFKSCAPCCGCSSSGSVSGSTASCP